MGMRPQELLVLWASPLQKWAGSWD